MLDVCFLLYISSKFIMTTSLFPCPQDLKGKPHKLTKAVQKRRLRNVVGPLGTQCTRCVNVINVIDEVCFNVITPVGRQKLYLSADQHSNSSRPTIGLNVQLLSNKILDSDLHHNYSKRKSKTKCIIMVLTRVT